MPFAWYLCPYITDTNKFPQIRRYCAMDDFTPLIVSDGGVWAETEVLGNHAIVKVRAALTTLITINAAAGFMRLPKDALDDPLSSLTNAQKLVLRNKMLSLGYTSQEITNRFGSDLGSVTLRELLRFIASRRMKPRWDAATQQVVFDTGIELIPQSVDTIDTAVR